MNFNLSKFGWLLARLAVALLVLGLIAGCSSTDPRKRKKDRENFFFPMRQLPQDRVYGTLRAVHLPNPLPKSDKDMGQAPRIMPIFEFSVKDTPLEEVAMILASAARYSSYCASTVAKQRVTFSGLGTVEELAALIAKETGTRAFMDHENRVVRFTVKSKPS